MLSVTRGIYCKNETKQIEISKFINKEELWNKFNATKLEYIISKVGYRIISKFKFEETSLNGEQIRSLILKDKLYSVNIKPIQIAFFIEACVGEYLKNSIDNEDIIKYTKNFLDRDEININELCSGLDDTLLNELREVGELRVEGVEVAFYDDEITDEKIKIKDLARIRAEQFIYRFMVENGIHLIYIDNTIYTNKDISGDIVVTNLIGRKAKWTI